MKIIERRDNSDRTIYYDYFINCAWLLLKRINYIKQTDSQVIATLVLNVTLPSLVIVNLNSAELKLSFSILPILMIIYGIVAKMIAVWFF
ncbi:AEC family malonate efflux carrier [Staphylococcus aureus]|nr:AEC family malonate efflux carrier [Staphylococcus aureus]